MTAKHPAAFINAIKESRDFDLAIAQLQETWDEYCTLKAASVKAGEVVAVRPLEWLPVHDGAWLRAESLGCVYELLVSAGDVSERQAAAQADYEARIRSALVVEPAPTASVGAMREACRQVAIVRATRCANDLATPPNIRGLGPDTHALEYGKRVALEIAHDIAALAAANQSDGGDLPSAETVKIKRWWLQKVHDDLSRMTLPSGTLGDYIFLLIPILKDILDSDVETLAAPQAVEAVSVEEVAAEIQDVVDETRRQNWKNGGAHQYDSDEAARMIVRAIHGKFKVVR